MHLGAKPKRDEIHRAVSLLFQVEDVVELRIPKGRNAGAISGYFDNRKKLAEAAFGADNKGPGVYVTLNPVKPELLARANNRLKEHAEQTTADRDILNRRWLPIDLDFDRPAGISTSDAEHAAAHARAVEVQEHLDDGGWPKPIYADSGNGAHLLYALPNLPNNEESTLLISKCLTNLSATFTRDSVKLDTTVGNPSRIFKAYGTVARKGDSTPERPHRLSSLISVPDSVITVTEELLRLLAETPASTDSNGYSAARRSPPKPSVDIDEWIRCGVITVVKGPEMYKGGLRWVLDQCPFNPAHKSPAIFLDADAQYGFKCLHTSCADKHWRHFKSYVRRLLADLDPEPTSIEEHRPNLTDLGNARRLVNRHSANIKFCHALNQWVTWTGTHWTKDHCGRVEQLAQETVHAMSKEASALPDSERRSLIIHSLRSEGERRLNAMVSLARSMKEVAIAPEDMDQYPFLFNCKNGTLDLKTGDLIPHRREPILTKCSPTAFLPGAKAPIFLSLLDRITNGNQHLMTFIQRAVGYSLTGDCREQVMFVCHGSGANGKSTLLNSVMDVLGESYAMQTPAEMLLCKPLGDGIPNDLARLKGTRFVCANEVEEGRRLAEARVKQLTGQDRMTARFLREEFFEFRPECKIFLICNHKPNVRSVDHAIWRRIRLIPFAVTIPEHDQDRELANKLRTESSGILNWGLEGCLQWQQGGLGFPEEVKKSTDAYRREMDTLSGFLAECCEYSAQETTAAADLYQSFRSWALGMGGEVLTQKAFGDELSRRNEFERERKSTGIVYRGVKLTERGHALKEMKDDRSS